MELIGLTPDTRYTYMQQHTCILREILIAINIRFRHGKAIRHKYRTCLSLSSFRLLIYVNVPVACMYVRGDSSLGKQGCATATAL